MSLMTIDLKFFRLQIRAFSPCRIEVPVELGESSNPCRRCGVNWRKLLQVGRCGFEMPVSREHIPSSARFASKNRALIKKKIRETRQESECLKRFKD